MKKIFICILAVAQISTYIFNAAQISNIDWQLVLNESKIEKVSDLDSYHDSYSSPLDYSQANITTSKMWEIDEEKENFQILNDKGNKIKGQTLKIENIGYEVNDELEYLDLLVTIDDATTIEGYSGPTYLKVADDLSSIYTSGYLQIDFTIEFFKPGSKKPLLISPILGVRDLDSNEVIGTSSFIKNAIVDNNSTLAYVFDNSTHLIASDVDASPNDPSKWVTFDFGNTSTINLTFGMNRLDQSMSNNVDGEYTAFDLRIKPADGKIIINNNDKNNYPVSDSEFEIYKGSTFITKVKTNSNGYAETKELAPGTYTIKQTSVSDQYIPFTKEITVELKADSNANSIGVSELVTNSLITGNVKVKVVDKTGQGVDDVKLNIYNKKDDKLVATITTNRNGTGITPKLFYGNYYIKVGSLPSQYKNNNQQFEFEINQNKQVLTLDTIVVNSNTPTTDQEDNGGYIRIQTRSATGTRYYVYDEDENLVDTIIIDEDGSGTSKKLPYGSYCVEGDGNQLCLELTSDSKLQDFVISEDTNQQDQATDDNRSTTTSNDSIVPFTVDSTNVNQGDTNDNSKSNSSDAIEDEIELINDNINDNQLITSESDEIILTKNYSSLQRYMPAIVAVTIGFFIIVLLLIKKGSKNE